MIVLLNYILKCLWENKIRTGLILCAIMISSGMLFSSISISSSLIHMQMTVWRSTYGLSDIVIEGNSSSPAQWFYMNEALTWIPSCEYIVGEISSPAILETPSGEKIQTLIRGIDWPDLNALTPIPLEQDGGVNPFTGGKIILGRNAADRYGLNTGDILYLTINGTRRPVKLCGIASPDGFLSGAGPVIPAVMPRTVLSSCLDVPGRVDRIFIRLKSPELKYRLITKLSIPYKRYTVRESFSETEVRKQTDRTAMPIIIVAVILSFMSVYILYSAFRVIMMERLPVIGTFRSIGATIRSTRSILLMESCAYGIVGGIAGCAFGIFLPLLSLIISRILSQS